VIGIMAIRDLLPSVLLAFGVGFLAANLLLAVDLVRFLRLRRTQLLTWRRPRSASDGVSIVLAVTLALLIAAKVVEHQYAPRQLFGESMMFVYYGCLVPASRRIARGFYEHGVWADRGFMPYTRIGAMAWRDGARAILLILPRSSRSALALTVPGARLGAVRRLLRDKIAAHDIEFTGGGLDLGHDVRDDV
jgi:hypothetical protein